jgi:hypothetical protein
VVQYLQLTPQLHDNLSEGTELHYRLEYSSCRKKVEHSERRVEVRLFLNCYIIMVLVLMSNPGMVKKDLLLSYKYIAHISKKICRC